MPKKYKKEQTFNKAEEPEVALDKNKIRIFHSFEEAEEAEIKDTLNQTPKERIAETVGLILRVFGITRDGLKKRKTNNSIKIIRYD